MSNILDQLRSASTGHKEWRVQNPSDGAYCMSFSQRDSINPERDAREWLEDHQRVYPESRFSQYVVACVDMLTDGERLAIEAADEIKRLRAQLHLAEVVRAAQVEGLTQGAAGWRERANQLEAEVAGLREDAERYRWLRSQVSGHRAVRSARPATFAFPGPMVLTPLGDIMRGSVAQHLDAAIDAALAARKGTTPTTPPSSSSPRS